MPTRQLQTTHPTGTGDRDALPQGSDQGKQGSSRRKWAVAALVAILCLTSGVALLAVGSGVGGLDAASAQTNNSTADYYENESYSGANDSWYGNGSDQGEATLDQIVGMAVRVPRFVIGTGDMDDSGTGYIGVLLTGLIMVGAAAAAMAGTGAGPVGGAVVAVATGYGLLTVGLAPEWIRILLLFAIGILATVAARRLLEG